MSSQQWRVGALGSPPVTLPKGQRCSFLLLLGHVRLRLSAGQLPHHFRLSPPDPTVFVSQVSVCSAPVPFVYSLLPHP